MGGIGVAVCAMNESYIYFSLVLLIINGQRYGAVGSAYHFLFGMPLKSIPIEVETSDVGVLRSRSSALEAGCTFSFPQSFFLPSTLIAGNHPPLASCCERGGLAEHKSY